MATLSSSFGRGPFKPLFQANQRRLRHMKCLLTRNLRFLSSQELLSCFFTLHQVTSAEDKSYPKRTDIPCFLQRDILRQIPESELDGYFYISEIVHDTLNPVWKQFEQDSFRAIESPSNPSFMFKLWVLPHKGSPTKLVQQTIDLKELHYIGAQLSQQKVNVPVNSIIIEMTDGFYLCSGGISGHLLQQINMEFSNALSSSFSSNSGIVANKPKVAPSFTLAELIRILAIQEKRKAIQLEIKEHVSKINAKLEERGQYLDKVQLKQLKLLRVSQLKSKISYQQKLLEEEKERVQAKRNELLPRMGKIHSSQISLLASKKMMEEEKAKLEYDKKAFSILEKSANLFRWRYIIHLRSVYPIMQSSDGKSLSVQGLRLPNSDFTGCDEEQIATALGMVCHMLFVIAKFLNLPLRYPMIPMCSRSIIRDDISQQVSPKFPLYSRGVDRTRFEYAVFLLNKNLEQLLNSMGLEVITLRHTLPNLQVFLAHCEKEREREALELQNSFVNKVNFTPVHK